MRNSIIIAIVLLLSSCSTQNLLRETKDQRDNSVEALDSVFQYHPNYQHHIQIDDKINISVWGQDDLSVGSIYGIYNSNEVYGKWLMVDAEGNIEVPKIGTLYVLDLTIIEIKKRLKSRLSEWLVNPIVDVKVLNKEITVLGEVIEPQKVKIDKDNNQLFDIIASCQGFDFYANLKYVKILRQNGPHVHVANINLTKSGDYTSRNIQLHPGDVVIVPSKSYKEFDKRISNIIPFTSTLSAAAIFLGVL